MVIWVWEPDARLKDQIIIVNKYQLFEYWQFFSQIPFAICILVNRSQWIFIEIKTIYEQRISTNFQASDGHTTLYLCEEKNIYKHALAKILRFEIKVRMSFFWMNLYAHAYQVHTNIQIF